MWVVVVLKAIDVGSVRKNTQKNAIDGGVEPIRTHLTTTNEIKQIKLTKVSIFKYTICKYTHMHTHTPAHEPLIHSYIHSYMHTYTHSLG